MTVTFRASFVKDLEAIRDVRVLRRVEKAIRLLEASDSLAEIPQLKRLQGHASLFRIRIGDLRMGLRVEGIRIDCVPNLHRWEIYRYFP